MSDICEKIGKGKLKQHIAKSVMLNSVARYAEINGETYEQMLENFALIMIETQDQRFADEVYRRMHMTYQGCKNEPRL